MSAAEDVKISLTVVINREKTKVLLADVDSDFVDILLSFMTLPLGKILRLFKEHYGDEAPVIGSLSTLYKSLADLDDAYFRTKEGKKMLLNPRSIFSDECRKLKYNLNDSQPTKYFYCGTRCGSDPRTISIYNIGKGKCTCGEILDTEISVTEPNTVPTDGIFVSDIQNFALSDDMQIRANASGFMVETLLCFGVTDVDGAESRTVHVGANEIMDLLWGLLFSRTPLTDVFIKKKRISHSDGTCNSDIPLHIAPNALNSNKMIVKIIFQRSTDKLLFVEADYHFVDFLFSMLAIPLGAVATLLNSNTRLGRVDDLHRSIEILDSLHFKANEIKTRFFEPKVPGIYLSDSQILPISDQKIKLYIYGDSFRSPHLTCYKKKGITKKVTIESPKGNGCHVRRPATFIVTDDLVVTPSSAPTFIYHLNMMKVGLSDIKQVEVEIGMEEALKILKASLITTGVLTKAFNHIREKQPKEEIV